MVAIPFVDEGIGDRSANVHRRCGVWTPCRAARFTCPASGKVYRVGMLETTPMAMNAANLGAFRQRLRELGYVEGRNLIIEYRSADGRSERFVGLATELVNMKVDLIVARGSLATQAAKNATRTIPVVMAAVGEPLEFVASLARPGGNVTGLSSLTVDLETKRLGLLRELLPGSKRIAALFNLDNPANRAEWKDIEMAAPSMGVKLQLFDVRNPEGLEPAFAAASHEHADGLIVAQDGLFHSLSQTGCGTGGEVPVARDLSIDGVRRGRRPDGLRAELPRPFSPDGGLRGQDIQGREPRRPACRAADEVRTDYQPKDREGPWHRDPAPLLLRADEVIQ